MKVKRRRKKSSQDLPEVKIRKKKTVVKTRKKKIETRSVTNLKKLTSGLNTRAVCMYCEHWEKKSTIKEKIIIDSDKQRYPDNEITGKERWCHKNNVVVNYNSPVCNDYQMDLAFICPRTMRAANTLLCLALRSKYPSWNESCLHCEQEEHGEVAETLDRKIKREEKKKEGKLKKTASGSGILLRKKKKKETING